MTGTVKDSHYISRFLLRNWERIPGDLRYFDFRDNRIKKSSARRMYVSETTFPAIVEKWLERTVETPIGNYLAKVKAVDAAKAAGPPQPTLPEWRAIVLALHVQGLRTELSKNAGDGRLSELATKRAPYLDELVEAARQSSDINLAFSYQERLFFPSSGTALFPLTGSMGAWFLPLHPRLYAIVIPAGAFAGSFADMHKVAGVASTFSAGLSDGRVVLPPIRAGADRRVITKHVLDCRQQARKLFELYRQLNDTIAGEIARAGSPVRRAEGERPEEARR